MSWATVGVFVAGWVTGLSSLPIAVRLLDRLARWWARGMDL